MEPNLNSILGAVLVPAVFIAVCFDVYTRTTSVLHLNGRIMFERILLYMLYLAVPVLAFQSVDDLEFYFNGHVVEATVIKREFSEVSPGCVERLEYRFHDRMNNPVTGAVKLHNRRGTCNNFPDTIKVEYISSSPADNRILDSYFMKFWLVVFFGCVLLLIRRDYKACLRLKELGVEMPVKAYTVEPFFGVIRKVGYEINVNGRVYFLQKYVDDNNNKLNSDDMPKLSALVDPQAPDNNILLLPV